MPKNEQTTNQVVETDNKTSDNTIIESEAEALIKIKQELTSLKEKSKKLESENKKLTNELINNNPVLEEETEPQEIVVDPFEGMTEEEITKNVFKNNTTNLEYWTNAIALHDKMKANGKRSPFLPKAKDAVITRDDERILDTNITIIRDIVDKSEGDPETFNFLFSKALAER